MSFPPPSDQFANYPRSGGVQASTLRALADGYFGLSTAFGINVVLNFAGRGLTGVVPDSREVAILVLVGYVLFMFAIIFFVTLPHNKKVGEGLGWSPSGPMVASLLMALNSAICCGAIGYAVVQSMVGKKLKEAGVPRGTFGYKKADVYAFIDQLAMQNQGPI
jgi:hypothetical protein